VVSVKAFNLDYVLPIFDGMAAAAVLIIAVLGLVFSGISLHQSD